MSKTKRRYTEEFKQETVKLALQSPSIDKVARDLGIPGATLHGWLGKLKQQPLINSTQTSAVDTTALLAENRRLLKELAQVKEEREILKKATAYFAKEHK